MFDLELDDAVDVQVTVLRNKAMGCSDMPNTAEILPGEVLCSDNMIRRETAVDVEGRHAGGTAYGSESLAKLCELYSVMGNSENLRGHKGQRTAEELCAWLNDLPKRSFKSRIEVEGDDKLVITDDAKGNPVHAFRYIGGTPGTYIGGDETRLLEPPQDKCAAHSPSHVIQYFDNGNAVKKNENYVYREYADEFICTYVPTSHVERITVGGTALFTEQEEMV